MDKLFNELPLNPGGTPGNKENRKSLEKLDLGIQCVDVVDKINRFVLTKEYENLSREDILDLLKLLSTDPSKITNEMVDEISKQLVNTNEDSYDHLKGLPSYIQDNYFEPEIERVNKVLMQKGIKIYREDEKGFEPQFNAETQNFDEGLSDWHQFIFRLDDAKKLLTWLGTMKAEKITDDDKRRLREIFINIKEHINPSSFYGDDDEINEFIEIANSLDLLSKELTRLGISVRDKISSNPEAAELQDFIEPLKKGYLEEYIKIANSFLYSRQIGPTNWTYDKKIDEIKQRWDEAFEVLDDVMKNPKADGIYKKLYNHLQDSLQYSLSTIPHRKAKDEWKNTNEEVVSLLSDVLEKLQKEYSMEVIENKEQKTNFEEQLSLYLNSEEFEKNILELEEKQRKVAIGSVIEYCILHKDQYGLDDFWKSLKNIKKEYWGNTMFEEEYYPILTKSVAKKLGLKQPMAEEDEKKAYEYVLENLILEGFYFHGFNGVFEDSIKKNGLSPNIRQWDVDELKEIISIGNKHNNEMLLGWHSSSENQLFVDHHPGNVYRYANASPEWFAQFTSESHWINDNGKGNKQAFYRRDYKMAKENVENLCQTMKLNEEENKKVLGFFDKYWALFVNEKSKPKCGLIKISAFSKIEELKKAYSYEFLHRTIDETLKLDIDLKPEETINFLFYHALNGNNQNTTKNIDSKEIMIIDLPEYNKIYPVLK